MRLSGLDVLVLDCQTTGATPALGHLLELGWAHAREDGLVSPAVARRIALPEGERLPRIIKQLTGLADAPDDAITPEEAWSSLVGAAAPSTEGVPTVIHFARFELVFLRDLHARFGGDAPFPFDVVCAHDIARRLLPDLPRRGLRALAGYFGHGLELERRSASHTEATAHVWGHLVHELARHDVLDWSSLRAWLEAPAPPPSRRRAYPMSRERQLALPDRPGVYRMLRSNGDVLYVGKALSLKQRVRSHFTQGKTSERALEMLTQVRDIQVTQTASVLEAALLENDEIKRIDPPYNVQLRERDAWFVSRDLSSLLEQPTDATWIGPLPSRFAMSSLCALRAMVAGDGPTAQGRGRSIGVPPAFAPDEATFAAGWAAFEERYITPTRSRTAWGRWMKASKTLLRLLGEGALEEGTGEGGWDPDRVRRHLERSLASGGQLLRRARFLCLVSDAVVAYREPGAASWRLLAFRAGELASATDLADPTQLPLPERRRPWLEKMQGFDGARYDRMRVLTTELKRVLAEGGEVKLRLDERRVLDTRAVRLLLSDR